MPANRKPLLLLHSAQLVSPLVYSLSPQFDERCRYDKEMKMMVLALDKYPGDHMVQYGLACFHDTFLTPLSFHSLLLE